MIQIIHHHWKTCSKYLVTVSVACVLICLTSDSVYFKPVQVQEPITAAQVSESCSPSKLINLVDVNVSTGTSWSLGHSYHCLGRPHIITTINQIGILPIDKLVSQAIVLNYVWIMNQTKEFSCSLEVEIVEPVVIEKDNSILFAPYILRCQNVQ